MSERGGRRPVWIFMGRLLMAAGALIALTTGACTLYVLASLLVGGSGDYLDAGSWALMIFVIGGLPCLIGTGLFFGGRSLSRSGRARTAQPAMERD